MPLKRKFSPPTMEEQEKKDLEDYIPKATRNATKWAFKVSPSGRYQGTRKTLHKSNVPARSA